MCSAKKFINFLQECRLGFIFAFPKSVLMCEYHNPFVFYTSYKELQRRYNLPFVPKSDEIAGNLSECCKEREKEFAEVLKDTPYLSTASFNSLCRCNCCEPVPVKLHGVTIFVGCGKCVLCLRRRREMWSKRLIDETQHNRHLHAFGVTLTYDSEHIPYLPVDVLANHTYTYYYPNKSHGYLDVMRGCSAASLAKQENISLLCGRDLDLYFRRFRKRLSKLFPYFYARYFFAGEYGEIDDLEKVDITKARTGRAHYHGIWFIGFIDTDESVISVLKEKLPNDYIAQIEQLALDCWEHAQQIWSAKKGIYIGKSIQQFGQNWGYYLGKYVNKNVTSQINGCIGAFYVPERIWSSRQSTKFGLPSLGVLGFVQSDVYRRVFHDLITAVNYGLQFVCNYKENGFTKCYPVAYKNYCIQKFFNVRLSRYTLFRQYYRAFERNNERNIRIVKSIRRIRQYSIYTPPPHKINEIGDVETIPLGKYYDFLWNSDEWCALCDLYLWKQKNNLSYLRFISPNDSDWQDIAVVKDDAGWHPFAIREQTYYAGIDLRNKVSEKAKEVFKKALEYKHEHNYKNGYLANLR